MGIITLKSLAEDMANLLTIENFKIIDGKMSAYTSREARYVAATLISRFIGALVYRTLSEPQTLNKTSKEHEDFVMKNTAELKTQIQNAVSAGFQNAMTAFSGENIEYYCQIKVVPESTSKAIN